jgi:hypothetical protein
MASTDNSDTDTIQSSQNDTLSKVKLVLYHQLPDIELVSPVYAGTGVTCYLPPDQKVDVGSTMQFVFDIDPDQVVSTGVLTYRLQRKNIDQSNEEAICNQFVVAWKARISGEFHVYLGLRERKQGHIWDEDELMRLAELCKPLNVQHGPVEDTWLLHDGTELMTSLNMTYEESCYKLETIIYGESTNNDIHEDTRSLHDGTESMTNLNEIYEEEHSQLETTMYGESTNDDVQIPWDIGMDR